MKKFLAEESGKRIDAYLAQQMEELSRSYIQKLLKEKEVLVNHIPVKANYKINAGDVIEFTLPEAKELDVLPEDIPLDILYEDADIIVINKPKQMVVHPANGHTSGTLVNGLLYHCRENLSGINGVLRPGIVHRIDMDTTGSLVVCKNDMAHQSLSRQLKEHSICRVYEAIVHGRLKEEEGRVEAPIGRHPIDRKKMSTHSRHGKPAATNYQVLTRFERYTHIACRLETGRTHQIRVHMASIGHPILGDLVYGPRKSEFPKLQGQTLHAKILGFQHPRTGDYMEFQAPLPAYFVHLLNSLK